MIKQSHEASRAVMLTLLLSALLLLVMLLAPVCAVMLALFLSALFRYVMLRAHVPNYIPKQGGSFSDHVAEEAG